MSYAAAILESIKPCTQRTLYKRTLLETIESSTPLSIVVGIVLAVIAFTANFSLGLCSTKLLVNLGLSFSYPINELAVGAITIAAILMLLSVRSGFKGSVTHALMFGSEAAFIVGALSAAIGV